MQPWQDPELEKVRESHKRFAAETLEPNIDAAERDREGTFDRSLWKACADHGVLGICMPGAVGGRDKPVSHAVAAFEGLGEASRASGFLYAMCSQLCGIQMTLRLHASKALQERYLPDLIAGRSMAAYGFTEEVGGSDAFTMETFAKKDGDGYRVNGRKCYITNAPHADKVLLFARTMEQRNPFALSAFVVDMDWQGASHGRSFEKVGLRTVHMGELIFDDVFVPKDHLVGGEGSGLQLLAESTSWERSILLCTALGPMRRGLAECIQRAKTRKQNGKAIGSFQQVSSKIADMTARYRISRQLIYDLATRVGDGKSLLPHAQDAAVAKLYVSENFVKFELDALQIFGVRGYLLENFVQQDLRDAVSSTIWGGTSESLRNTIAKLAGLPVG